MPNTLGRAENRRSRIRLSARFLCRISLISSALCIGLLAGAWLYRVYMWGWHGSMVPSAKQTSFFFSDAASAVADDLTRWATGHLPRGEHSFNPILKVPGSSHPASSAEVLQTKFTEAFENVSRGRLRFSESQEQLKSDIQMDKKNMVFAEAGLMNGASMPILANANYNILCNVSGVSASSSTAAGLDKQLFCQLGLMKIGQVGNAVSRAYISRARWHVDGMLCEIIEWAFGLGFWSLAAAGVSWLVFLYKRRRALETIEPAMRTVQGLLDGGSFRAAEMQIDLLLEYLPEERAAEAHGLRDRLDVFLDEFGGDAREAERTALRVKNIRGLLETPGAAAAQLESAAAELSDLRGAGAAQLKVLVDQEIDKGKILIAYDNRKRRIQELLDSGRLESAAKEISGIPSSDPARRELEGAAEAVAERRARAEEAFEEAERLLGEGRISEWRRAIEKTLSINREHPRAEAFRGLSRPGPESPLRRLRPLAVGKPVFLMHKNSFLLGREARPSGTADLAVPDPDGRVSREHLLLTLAGERLIAENKGRNGSFVGGEPLQKAALSSGDIVNLARSAQFEVFLHRVEIAAAGARRGAVAAETVLDGGEPDPAPARSSGGSRASGGSRRTGPKALAGVFLSGKGWDLLWGTVPVRFSAAGLEPDGGSDVFLRYQEGILLFSEGSGSWACPLPGETVESKGVSFVYEAGAPALS